MSPGPATTDLSADAASTETARGDVLRDVAAMIVDIVGEDYLLDLEIDMETAFNDDLELESIEFVALAERLTDRYGERVDFVAWLADMELDDLIAMTVGQLVEFVGQSLEATH